MEKKERYGFYGINGIYYTYDRELHCIPSCSEKEYFETEKLNQMEMFLRLLNSIEPATVGLAKKEKELRRQHILQTESY